MKPIDVVIRMRSLDNLDREYKERANKVGYHDLAKGTTCHCDECNRLREENSQITARIREVRVKEKEGGNGH